MHLPIEMAYMLIGPRWSMKMSPRDLLHGHGRRGEHGRHGECAETCGTKMKVRKTAKDIQPLSTYTGYWLAADSYAPSGASTVMKVM
jgi:hypothetical protein